MFEKKGVSLYDPTLTSLLEKYGSLRGSSLLCLLAFALPPTTVHIIRVVRQLYCVSDYSSARRTVLYLLGLLHSREYNLWVTVQSTCQVFCFVIIKNFNALNAQ